MDLTEVLKELETNAAGAIPVEDEDYFGDNGLLYCGKCNTPKQTEIRVYGITMRPMCLCKCAQKMRDLKAQANRMRMEQRKIDRLRDAGFPDGEMKTWCFAADDRKNEKISKIARKYVDNFPELYKDGKGLLFFGGVGTGKTFAAACIANALIDRGYPCLVTNFARLVNQLNETYAWRQDFLDSLDEYALIVIDDLAAERDTGYMNEVIQSVIDARYRIKKPLIITTNLDAAELKNPKNQSKMRVYSRLYEMCIPVEVEGVDRRRGKLWESTEKYGDILGLKGEAE